jgi:hypothetical protein
MEVGREYVVDRREEAEDYSVCAALKQALRVVRGVKATYR